MNLRVLIGGILILLVIVGAAFFGFQFLNRDTIRLADVHVAAGEESATSKLAQVVRNALVIDAATGTSSDVLGYVGILAIRDKSAGPEDPWDLVGEFRPATDQLQITPVNEKLFEGIVTTKISVAGSVATFSGELGLDEAAEVLIANSLVVGFKDNTTIPWQDLKAIRFDPAKEYWFVDSAVVVDTTSRRYQKVDGKAGITGVAFSANGSVYSSQQQFASQKKLILRMFNLRYMRPAEGVGQNSRLGELLAVDDLDAEQANELLDSLRTVSAASLPAEFVIKKN
jgi:hypothetical protein